jgi:hypothetical protein
MPRNGGGALRQRLHMPEKSLALRVYFNINSSGAVIMYYVTYRNVLKGHASLDDYRRGLQHVWPTLKSWGAVRVEMFQELYDESGAFYTHYFIESLDQWNSHVMSPEFAVMLKHLNDILDLSMSEVTVAVSLPSGIDQ